MIKKALTFSILSSKVVMAYFIFLSEALQWTVGTQKFKSRLFHQFSWNFEAETTWISLICWLHKVSTKERLLYLDEWINYFNFFSGLMMAKRRKKANWEKKILVFLQISNTSVMWAGIPTRVYIFFNLCFPKWLEKQKYFFLLRFRFRKCGSKVKTVFLQSWSFRTRIAR